MKVDVLQEKLKEALGIVGYAVTAKSSMPVLGNVLFATDNGKLRLEANNLVTGVTCWVGAVVHEEGTTTVPAKLLSDLVGGLPNDLIRMTLEDRTDSLQVVCANVDSMLKCISADNFHAIPRVDTHAVIQFDPTELRKAIDQVSFAAATDDTRPVLTGVLLRVRDSTATFAAADGFRLAVKTLELGTPAADPFDAIIPGRALQSLSGILAAVEGMVDVMITPNGSHVLFHTEQVAFVSRLIEGKFPDFERIVPATHTTHMILPTSEFAKAVKLGSYFANASANIIKLTMEPSNGTDPGRMTISANAAEVGDNQSALDGTLSGDGGYIALNVKFLMEALAVIPSTQVAFQTQTPQSPGVLLPIGDDSLKVVVMPMTVR